VAKNLQSSSLLRLSGENLSLEGLSDYSKIDLVGDFANGRLNLLQLVHSLLEFTLVGTATHATHASNTTLAHALARLYTVHEVDLLKFLDHIDQVSADSVLI